MPIWTKLGLIMIVPTIATIVVGTVGLLDHVQSANNADRARTLAVLSGDAGRLVHGLQNEQATAIRLLGAGGGDTKGLQAAYTAAQTQTDAANKEYRFRRSTLADVPDNLRQLLDSIETQLGELPEVRSQVAERNAIPLTVADSTYRALISNLLSIRNLAAQLAGDITLADRMRAAADVATAKEYLSQERVVVLQALQSGELVPAARANLIATQKAQEQALLAFQIVATPQQRELLDRTVTGPELRETLRYEGSLNSLTTSKIPSGLIPEDKWDKAMIGRSDLMNEVEIALNQQARDAATDLGNRVQRQVLLETGLLLLTLVLGVMLAWIVARSMARSLRELRQGALAVAQYGLPQAVARLRDPAMSSHMSATQVAQQIAEPLPVRSRDEFGQVTEAFNAVHLEAVRTAAEQAALRSSVATMFVNLARRSQILVDRLIGHLDRLERGEQDPDRLSELFQLDHLATRMRRNDENLLVLAGADSTRIQREPAALPDVLRAAQSEVEHYTRIEFGVIDADIEVASHAVNDLVHLVAELFDNATAFSPPDSVVLVEARRVGDRVVLQVEDRGIGMSPDQYAELNERLATPPMVDVAVSRMMGLVVVARLAVRHGIKVELRPATERGTVADVLLPSGVLVPRALAGRTHAPTGFPAARPDSTSTIPAPRSASIAPLALESGPSMEAGTSHGPSSTWATSSARPDVPSTDRSPKPPPSRIPGLGAALAGDTPSPANGAPPARGASEDAATSRALPAWHDLTGAGEQQARIDSFGSSLGAELSESEPLPQRRPASPGEAQAEDPAPPAPRQAADDYAASAGTGLGQAWAAFGASAPAGPGESQHPDPATSASQVDDPPAAVPPPSWPPVAAGPAAPSPAGSSAAGGDPYAASGDMTAEIPKVRVEYGTGDAQAGAQHTPAPPARYADDLTMELPIFRELESAWFQAAAPETPADPATRTGAGVAADASADTYWPAAEAGAASAGRVRRATEPTGPSQRDQSTSAPAGSPAMAGASMAKSSSRSAAGAESGSATGGSQEVSWRTVADDGWTAAQAAAEPADGGQTGIGLPRRVPMAQLVPGGVDPGGSGAQRRTPEAVRGLLSAYHRGVQRGRTAQGKTPESAGSPTQRGGMAASTATDSGKEQEA